MRLELDADDLKPLIRSIIAEVLDAVGPDPGRMAFDEAESAKMIGVPKHVLRDDRLRGRIQGAKVGRKTVYTRAALLDYLQRRED